MVATPIPTILELETADVSPQEELQGRSPDWVEQAGAGPNTKKARTYVHTACNTENELRQEEYDDLYANSERYRGLPCSNCGPAAISLSELVWKGTDTEVLSSEDTHEKH